MFRVRPINRMGIGEAIEQTQPLKVVSPYSKYTNKGSRIHVYILSACAKLRFETE